MPVPNRRACYQIRRGEYDFPAHIHVHSRKKAPCSMCLVCSAMTTRLIVSAKQVEVELHDALLKHDGLVEPTATNQGAWLTESAGALSDLHSTVLGSLAGLCVREDPAQPSHRSALSRDAVGVSEARGVPNGADMSSSRRGVDGSLREANIGEDRQETLRKQSGSGRPLAKEAIVSVGPHGTSRRGGAARAGEAEPRGPSAPQDRGATTATATTVAGCGRRQAEGRRNQRRARLRHLGLLLARKRQFAASRQVCAPSGSSTGRPPSPWRRWQ